uniref:39S ribosomal protein L9, mitochondrial n=1 Tax=Caligus clemensi TaxID=344056 RepID=C1BZZ8_CALCM|nr:39S ribosomal protein L9, mitochondrial precursor [Caligus clemensi]
MYINKHMNNNMAMQIPKAFLFRRSVGVYRPLQRRSLVVVERVHEPPRFPEGTPRALMEKTTWEARLEKHQTYRILQEEDEEREVSVLLLTDIEGVGIKGSIVSLPEDLARQRVLLPRLGVYSNEDNRMKHKDILIDEEKTQLQSSDTAKKTHQLLSQTCLGVRMSGHNPWTLKPKHISAAFLLQGFVVPVESITIPKEIAGPNRESLEDNEFFVRININNLEEAFVRCVLKHTSIGMNNLTFPYGFQYKFREPIFEEDRKFLLSLPREPFTQKAKEMAEFEEEYIKYQEWYEQREKKMYRAGKEDALREQLQS